MKRIRKNDEVVVISGRSKGVRGTVLRVRDDNRLIVEGVNMVKRHTKPDPQREQPGGIIEKESPIHISNVMLYNAATSKGDKVSFKILEDGKKVRVFRSNDEVVDI